MSAGTRLPLDEARVLADEVVGLLAPACEKIAIAGSIRRQKADIGDIEIIAIPKMLPQFASVDMFGMGCDPVETNMLTEMCAGLLARGIFHRRLNTLGRTAWGADLKWGTYKGFALDIYAATPETWGVTMAIRTGPADFSHRLVTSRRMGGLCPSYLKFKGWRIISVRHAGQLLDTPEERDVFTALGLKYIPPESRERALAGAR